jgi:hypothetical protein
MPTPYRITDLNSFTGQVGTPTGQEIAEISNGGLGSYQVPLAVLALGRAANTVGAGGTFNVSSQNYGDVLVTTTAAVTVQLPAAATRFGAPVSVIAQQTTTPNITISPFGAETIMGQASLTIGNSYGAFTLWPLAGGGWYQK